MGARFGLQLLVLICPIKSYAHAQDLDQSNPRVAQLLNEWVQGLVYNYSVDGIRIDTVPEVNAVRALYLPLVLLSSKPC